MTQGNNDLEQLKKVVRDLANVYKTQVTDNISDNGNLSTLNNAILNVKCAIKWIEDHQPGETDPPEVP